MSVGAGAIDPLIKEAHDRHRRRRRRLVGLVLAAVIVGTSAYFLLRGSAPPTGSPGCVDCSPGLETARPRSGPAFFGIQHDYAAPPVLARVDAKTLELVGPRLTVPKDLEPAGISPDGARLLLVNARPQHATTEVPLSVVDLATMRREQGVDARIARALGTWRPTTALWLTSRRVLVVAEQLGRRRWREGPHVVTRQLLLALDARTGTVAWRRTLGASFLASPGAAATVRHRAVLVLVSAHPTAAARARVLTVGADGTVASASLGLVEGGYGRYPARLVVTSGAQDARVLVLTGGGVVYEIDSATARSTRHRLPTPAGAPETSPPVLLLGAAAIGSRIVVSSFFPRANGFAAAGVYLIDPRTWTTRILDRTTPGWLVADNRLITFTVAGQFRRPSSWKTKGTGIRIYDEDGRLQAHLYGSQAFDGVMVTPRNALAVLPGRPQTGAPPQTPAEHRARERAIRIRMLAFDPRSGRSLGVSVHIGYPPGLIVRPSQTAPRR